VEYVVILERGKGSVGAYVPDLPGCAAIGETKEEALRLIREGIELHLAGMREEGLPIPEPTSSTELVKV
jgi:predicted RNase H-like HicB family nuclease